MAGTKKDFTDYGYSQYAVGALHVVQLFRAASVGAGVAVTTVQDRFITPSRVKISSVALYASAVNTIDGSITFNIVVGSGSYDTGAVAATDGAVWTGTPNHDGTVTVTVAGHAVVYTEVSGDTTPTILMGHVAAAVNADGTVGPLVTATNTAGHLILTWNEKGTNGNGQTLSVATTDSGTVTFVADSATFSGGVNGTGATPVQNDNVTLPYYQQASSAIAGQIAGGGSGITTNFAVAGQALFAQDVQINAANTPLMTTSGGSAVFGDIPTAEGGAVLAASDAVFQRGQLLTLRVSTPAVVGSISNLIVSAVMEVRPLNWPPDPTQVQPNSPIQGFVTPANATQLGTLAPQLQNVRPVSGLTF